MHEERQEQIKEHRKKMAKVIAKAWSDRSFKEKLFSDPKTVLEANGVILPTGLEVKVVEQTNKLIYVVIPFRPEDAEGGSWQCEDDTYDTPCIRCN
jgi:hypothetical protein